MKKKGWIPVLVIVLFGIESIFSNYFPAHLFSLDFIFVPRFLLLFLIFLTVYYHEKTALIYALALGAVMDIVFTDILGIYLFWYPVIVYLISRTMKVLHNHLIIVAFISMLAIALLEFGIYGLFYLLQQTDFTVEYFTNNRLYPSLVLNFIFYIIVAVPFKKYLTVLQKEKEEEEGMFQSQ